LFAYLFALNILVILVLTTSPKAIAQNANDQRSGSQVFFSYADQRTVQEFAEPATAEVTTEVENLKKTFDAVVEADIGSVKMDSVELNEFKNNLDDQLFITKKYDKELFWPSFPRIWTERSYVEQRNITMGALVNVNPFSIGLKFKRTLSNQYSLKTTFVLISSNKPNDPKKYQLENGDYPILRSIFNTGADNLIYANIDGNFPMVGFCSFEAKYSNEQQQVRGSTVIIATVEEEKLQSEPVSYYVTSKLFQINAKIPIKYYLHNICNQAFKNKIETKIMADIEKVKQELEFRINLAELNLKTGLCKPVPVLGDQEPNTDDEPCASWHQANFNQMVVTRTIAKCSYDKNLKNNYCELRSKENRTCPIYWDLRTKKYFTELIKAPRTAVAATAGHYEFPCDVENGFQCQFSDKPFFLFDIPFITGRGVCVRISK
jgi:hypothetical protein